MSLSEDVRGSPATGVRHRRPRVYRRLVTGLTKEGGPVTTSAPEPEYRWVRTSTRGRRTEVKRKGQREETRDETRVVFGRTRLGPRRFLRRRDYIQGQDVDHYEGTLSNKRFME